MDYFVHDIKAVSSAKSVLALARTPRVYAPAGLVHKHASYGIYSQGSFWAGLSLARGCLRQFIKAWLIAAVSEDMATILKLL